MRQSLRHFTLCGAAFFVLLACAARPATAQILFAADSQNDQLVMIDGGTGHATVIGPFGFDENAAGLATKPDGSLWALFSVGGTTGIYSIDVSTGAASLSVDLDIYLGGFGAEFDPTGTVLYIVSGNLLYAADPTAGITTLLTSTLSTSLASLAGTPSGTYYAVTAADLYTVDVSGATASLVGALQGQTASSSDLAYDPASGFLYCVRSSALIRIDPSSLQSTLVGNLGGSYPVGGLAVVPSAVGVSPTSWSVLKSHYGE